MDTILYYWLAKQIGKSNTKVDKQLQDLTEETGCYGLLKTIGK